MIARPADFCPHRVVQLYKRAGAPLAMRCRDYGAEGLTPDDLPGMAALGLKVPLEELEAELERRRV
jgi:hypothetical protein